MAEEGNKAKITITDSGSSIPAEVGEKLFQRFYQVKSGSNQEGFGIGLYLVKVFIEAHGWTISYTSQVGKGASFFISLNVIKTSNSTVPETNTDSYTTNVGLDEENKIVKEDTLSGEAENNIAAPVNSGSFSVLKEVSSNIADDEPTSPPEKLPQELTTEKQSLLLIDDDKEILSYLVNLFKNNYRIYKADSAEDGIKLAHEHLPDLIISDIVMKGLNGIDFCRTLKEDETVSHIPIILLTGTSSDEVPLKAMETGADDYVKKPFDKDLLTARVKALLKRRNILQHYFFNEVTLGNANYKISAEYKDFLNKCMAIIEKHLEDDQFSIKILTAEMSMSHSNLYKKVKSVSGQTIAGFIRFIRLRKAAELLINTENNVNETADIVGFNDTKYFRVQFSKQFGITPSEYIKKDRKSFNNTHSINDQFKK